MDKIKGKYEIILGFITVIISLSAFKDELNNIHLDLGYLSITLYKYFIYSIIGFAISIYLYILEAIFSDTKFGNLKLFNYLIRIAYYLFTIIIITPILLSINILIVKILSYIPSTKESKADNLKSVITIVSVLISIIQSYFTSRKLLKDKIDKEVKTLETKEILELDNANKLFKDGYYSHAILEAFKALETHIYKELTKFGIRVTKHNTNDLLENGIKSGIILGSDLSYIQELRKMRNIAAHTNELQTMENAKNAITFIKEIVSRAE